VTYNSTVSRARVGVLSTPHGAFETPSFVPVATNGALKYVTNLDGRRAGTQLMFCNTYHLNLHPGPKVIAELGGLHKFMKYDGPLITDSGGFQIFSLAARDGSNAPELKGQAKKRSRTLVRRVSEEGVEFVSYRDGSRQFISPESTVDIQKDLGADIIIPLDELLPLSRDGQDRSSFDRTHRWQKRSLDRHLQNPKDQFMFAVIHGGTNPDLRKESCETLQTLPFDGFAIGGSLGASHEDLQGVLHALYPTLSLSSSPRHLLGIGDKRGILSGVRHGIDTFDSVYPAQLARHGTLLSGDDVIRIGKQVYATDKAPVEETCSCMTCQRHCRGYLRHLYKAKEGAYLTLATIHNLHHMMTWMASIRDQIREGNL